MWSKKGSIFLTIFSLLVIAAMSFGIFTTAQKERKKEQEKKAAAARSASSDKETVDNIAVTQTKESQEAMTPERENSRDTCKKSR